MNMITIDRALVEQALEALENLQPIIGNGLLNRIQLAFIDPNLDVAITALRAALAQQAEPVAWYQKRGQEVLTSHPACWGREDEPWTPLYTAPPQRKPLTSDKDRPDQGTTYVEGYGYVDTRAVRAVERAHGIGGQP